MSYDYDKKLVAELVPQIKAAGFRVFVAERGTYGFYTDKDGERVVSFGVGLSGVTFSGNCRSRRCGTGWRLDRAPFVEMLWRSPPDWATRGEAVTLTTLQQHLDTYQKSSRYTEVLP